ncbi:MAG: nitrous oxide reductase accessory protein NosL [Zoogloea sp.]|uniref:nitrous oxide reductase accessory protein NosL n=1 Tax=Zoogloea sp. TaxID=49181 RepID=UPI003F3ED870
MLRALIAPLLCALTLGSLPAQAADLSPKPVERNARCPVCGMYPSRTPQWMAQIVFNDQTASSFDSPLDLFRFLNNMVLFDKTHKPADVGAVWVADYQSKAWIDARKAFFVLGSKAPGPMGESNLPAFTTRDQAQAFTQSQGGKVLTFGDITREVIKSLNSGHGGHQH